MPRQRHLFCLFLAAIIVVAAYLFGAFSFSRNLWPIDELRTAKRWLLPREDESTPRTEEPSSGDDEFGRLSRFHAGKEEIACPAQQDETLVLLLIGQSNSANWHGQRHSSAYGDKVVNFFDGRCFVASSPLLGTTDQRGEAWTLLGNRLIADGLADRVILVPSGIARSSIDRWQAGGDLNGMLQSVVATLDAHYRITHVLWHQGESDFAAGTSSEDYSKRFLSLATSLRTRGVDAPIFVSVATWCGANPAWTADNPVALAQKMLPDPARGIHAGVDTDALLGLRDRYDDCHFSGSGQEKFAEAWLQLLRGAHGSD